MSDGGSKARDATPKARIEATRSVDPGDQTERNYRYQHQYGVVLLAAVCRGSRDYISIYCEHHEDFLCERADGLFDGYTTGPSEFRSSGGASSDLSAAKLRLCLRATSRAK
ncbi:dsDNA nuclease domain-containing protein [Caulobacter segnis]|uniref:dsDNA nuclease domain-containing protein n=1 Tax=Caulobacter segnis TaxID=88688 RepID=UPI003857E150